MGRAKDTKDAKVRAFSVFAAFARQLLFQAAFSTPSDGGEIDGRWFNTMLTVVSSRSAFSDIRAKAMRLSPLERARLTNELFTSLGRRRLTEIEHAWDEEIAQRVAAFAAGRMPTTPAGVVMEDVRRDFGWQK